MPDQALLFSFSPLSTKREPLVIDRNLLLTSGLKDNTPYFEK